MPDNTQQEYIDNKKVIRYTDNLIDLLEVGDMVEGINDNKTAEIYYVSEMVFKQFDYMFEETPIVAIWKRNGNRMYRYEVGAHK